MYSIEHINNEVKIKPQDITLFLAKLDKTKIAKLKHVSGKLLTIKSQETNQLSFNVPYWIDIDHKLVKNPHIDKFKEKYLIEANFNNKTEWFVINSIVKTSEESDDLQISCMSLEYLLNYRYMVEYENTGNCLMLANDTLKGTGFKVGYINPKFNLMYRRLEITRQTKLATIYQIAETFGAIVRFDTVNMTVNFYTEDEVYQYKGFSIGYGKYIQNIEEKIDPDEIVTRLYVFGSDGMSINGVNPTGQSYIDDFSYFLYPFEMDDEGNVIQSSEYMSDDLAKALVLYNKYVSERKGLFSNYLNEKRELQIQKTEKENQLSDLELELQIILDAIVVAKADNQPTKELTRQRDNLNKEINKIKNEIKGIDEEINRIDENIEKLREDLRYENHLTEEQLKELQNFIHEAEFTDENLFDETELYEAGLQEIKKVNTPPITINTSLVNFFKIISERHNWDRFDIDDIIRINHERLGTDIKIKLNEFQIDFDNNDIDVVATNNDFIDNVDDKISRLFYTIDKVDTEQRKRKINWEKVAYNFNLRNDRIEDKPTNPTNAIITHKENDDGSVNLILKWDYPDFNKTGKNADNIDGFTIFLHADEDNEPYQFGSRMGEEVIVSEIPYTSRSYVFPSVPANLYYTVGIKAYRRVDEDVNLDGILFSDLIVFKSDENVKSNQVQTFSLMSTVTQEEDNDENDFKLIDPYQPSPEVNIKALINGARIIPSLSEPNNPKINDIWIDLADKKVKIWDGSAWSGDIKIEQIEKELKNHEEYMKEFEEQLNEELEKAQKELEEAMQQVEEEMRRIEEVLPEIERAVDETYIPHSEFPPEEVPTSGLWMDTSQDPPRLMRWDSKLADYVPLAPTEQEIQELMEKMREEAKTESIRYSKLDILKVRKTLTDRIDKEVEKVLEDIQRLENIKNDLINRVNDVESYVDYLRDTIGDDIEEIQKIVNDMRELADEINDLVSDIQNRLGDFEGRIVTIENEVDEINGKISSTIEAIERVDGIVSQHQSTLEQHSDMIAAKVDSITYQEDKAGIISEIEKNTTAIELLDKQIKLKADQSVVDNINQEITNINTELSLQAGKIESKVDRTEYNELENTVSQNTSRIEQTEKSIQQTITRIESAEDRLDKAESDIRQNAEAIELRATKQEVELIEGNVASISEEVGNLTIAYNNITSEVSRIEQDLDGKIQSNTTLIQQTAQGINARIDSFEYEYNQDKTDILTSIERNESAISALADSIELMVTKEEYRTDMENIDEFISSTNATLQLHANALEAKAERSELVNYVDKQTYTNQIGELNVAIDGISGRVSKTEADINKITGDVNSLSTQVASLDITVNGITATVESLETDMQSAQQSISQIQQTANSITQTVSALRFDFDNLEIGGRNLYKSSDNIPLINAEHGITYQKISDGIYKNVWKFTKADTSSANFIKINDSNLVNLLEPDKEFTVSILAKGTPRTGFAPILRFYFNSSTNYKNMSPQVGSNYTWVSFTFKTSDVTPAMHIGMINFKELYIALIKIEKGNKATDWTPAPEDVDAQIIDLNTQLTAVHSTIEQLPDQINLAVSEGIANIEIGGRNLWLGETKPQINNASLWADSGVESDQNVYAGTKSFVFKPLSGTSMVQYLRWRMKWRLNQTYTASVYIYDPEKVVDRIIAYHNGVISNGNVVNIGNDFYRYIVTFTSPIEGYPSHGILVYTNTNLPENNGFYVSGFKFETGNKATDWTPAPEDQVDKTNILSSINLSTEGVKIQGNKIDLVGLVTALNADGTPGTMIHGNKIVTGSITANQLNVNNIFSNSAVIGQIQSNAIATASLSANQITTGTLNAARIASRSITAEKLVSQTITANELAANSVTAAKIAANAVTADKIAANAVTSAKIAANAVTAEKINVNNLSAISANLGTVTAGHIQGVTMNLANNKFVVDSQGNVKFGGSLEGASGTFGEVTAIDGDFFFQDANSQTKYGIITKTNLITDHSFELAIVTGNVTSGGYFTSWDSYTWGKVGTPRLFSGYNTDTALRFMFGFNYIGVNNSNYIRTSQSSATLIEGRTYTFSSHFMNYTGSPTPKLRIKLMETNTLTDRTTTLQTWEQTFPTLTNGSKIVRHSITFTLTRELGFVGDYYRWVEFEILSGNSSWLYVDGVQLVEGNYPTIYEEESSLWMILNGLERAKSFEVRNIYSHDRITATFSIAIKSSGYSYLRPDNPNNELRVANSSGQWSTVRAYTANPSSEKWKSDIKDVDFSAIEVLKQSKIYSYIRDGKEEREIGFVLERETPEILKDGEGINSYTHSSLNTLAIQELIERLEQLEGQVAVLTEENEQLKSKIEKLKDNLNA